VGWGWGSLAHFMKEKIEDHRYNNVVFPNHKNRKVRYSFLIKSAVILERLFEERKIVKS